MSITLEKPTIERDCPLPVRAPRLPVMEDDLPITVIEPSRGWQLLDVAELWRFRELLYFLAWRDVILRYKQTVLGAAWAILQPLATMVVFSFCFGRLAADADAAVPYALFVFAGLIPWTFFSATISNASNSVISNQTLITKVYFPRLIVPMSAIGASAVDFAVAFGMLIVLMLCYAVIPGPTVLVLPLLVAGLAITALGIGTLLCALTVAYRDFRFVVPFMVQLWMFATPSIYIQNPEALGAWTARLALLNPAHGFIVNFRAALFDTPLDFIALATATAVGAALTLLGGSYFRKVERSFADIV
ncbi:MAG: ABC transporter permease [Gemmataceae bacterium]|nr:ABC transporter permease [Gemmataceae bacterium]